MKKMARVAALTLSVVMALSMLAGCGGSKDAGVKSGNTASPSDAKKEVVNLTVCLPDTEWGSSRDTDLQAAVIKKYEEKTSTKINAIIPPQGSYKEKLNVLISSGDIPDVLRIMQAMSFIPGYASRGILAPLDQYIEKSPLLSSIDKSYYEYINFDGKKYFIPRNHPQTKNLWIRKDAVDKFGIKLSSSPTTEEFYTEMKKVTGMIPFTFPKFIDNFRFFYNAFGVFDGIYKDSTGKFVDGFSVPETKEALTYIKKLYADGIIDKEFITNENNAMREKLSNGKAAVDIDYINRYAFYLGESKKFKVETDFSPIQTLVGPKGKKGNLNEAIQDGLSVSAKSKNIQRAVDFIEYVYRTEEGSIINNIGLKDMHYSIDNGVGKPMEKAVNSGYSWNPGFVISYIGDVKNLGFKWDEATEKAMPQQLKLFDESKKFNGFNYAVPAGISDEHDKVAPSIKKTREEIATKVVLGSVSVDDGMKEYEKFWKSINGDNILKELNSKK